MRSEVFAYRSERAAETMVSIGSNPENNPATNFIRDKLADQMMFWKLDLPASLECESHFSHKYESLFV